MATILRAEHTDITKLSVDVIVNAANSSLLGGGGVDGAIHRAAGPELVSECRLLGGCKTGQAKLTRGYNLPAHHIIHTVGPVWRGGDNDEQEELASCYRESIKIAIKHQFNDIAFPCISTGIFGYPADLATHVAIGTVSTFLDDPESHLTEVIFCCFSTDDYSIYEKALSATGH